MTKLLTSPRTKRAANVLGIVLLIALVAPFAVYAAPEVVGADESFVVLTASMTPAIAPGDVVIVAERDPTAIAEGDVITFVRGTSDVPVTHRVIDVVDEAGTLAFETMGDANEGPDPGLVPAGSLVGAVTLTIPYVGYVIQFAGTRVGFVALVLFPFGLLAATEIWSIVRGRDGSESQPSMTVDPVDPVDEPGDGDGATAGLDPVVGPDPAAGPGPAAEIVTAQATEEASGSGGVSVDAVGGAAAVLAAFAPYAVYVAFELRTAVAISVAIGVSTLLLGALAAWVPASGVLDRSGGTPDPAVETDASGPTTDAMRNGDSPESDGGASEPNDTVDSAAVAAGAETTAAEDGAEPASTPGSTPVSRPEAAGEGD
ncbi:S26 family signal peptidase [Halorubrum ezzemoulense DSM 17463]|uniref:S26 family signal peptidase n=3 Tax=Halorubrum ezzemoulense TaxID=337243 RepID=A0A256JAF0_HALEZ|nr:signal peptidase I [Halorubrum ezzemoulense]OSP09068.1 S26 family signal peptidase [Halorubrum ezzemoulense DSM 17463]OYR60297.1 S26 family signal peptidase [Halorubrum ezzemoulense]OYR65546.1 S26 family signal peptidase [Halorubrum ezzemoulense]